jgi:hypothetical protein
MATHKLGGVFSWKMNREAFNRGFLAGNLQAHDTPGGLVRAKITTGDVLGDLVDGFLRVRDGKPSVIGSLMKVFVQVREDGDGEDNVNIYMAIKIVDQFGNVGRDPAIILRCTPVLDTAVIVDGGKGSDRPWIAINAFVSFPAATVLSCEVILGMGHVTFDLVMEWSRMRR